MNTLFSFRRHGQLLMALTAIASLACNGCNSGVMSTLTGTSGVTGSATMTQPLITDAPSDQVLALGLTVNSIRLFDAAGKYADVLTAPVTIEAAHLDAVQEPLRAALSIPQDTYTSALITVSSPSVTYVDPTTHKPVQATATLTATTDTVTFATPIVVTATSAPLCFDLLVAQSVVLTGSAAAVTPTFNVTQIPLAHTPTNGGNGRVNDIFGSFVAATGTSLTLLTANGTQIVIATDSNTVLQGFTSLATLTAGQLLDVDVAGQSTGSLLALRIHLAPGSAANELIGPVTATTGSPVTSFTQTIRQWVGTGTAGTTAGTPYTIAVASTTTFLTGNQLGMLPALPFTPVFSAATLTPGQNVAVEATTLTGTTATAGSVTLVPQTVSGTVATIAQSGGYTVYTVTLPTGSALGTLSGAASVVVYADANTQFTNASTVAVGMAVRFNGLLFKDGSTLRLVSGACADQPGAAPPQKHA